MGHENKPEQGGQQPACGGGRAALAGSTFSLLLPFPDPELYPHPLLA